MSRLRDDDRLPRDAAAGLRFAVVASRFNESITQALAGAATEALREHGAARVDLRWVRTSCHRRRTVWPPPAATMRSSASAR